MNIINNKKSIVLFGTRPLSLKIYKLFKKQIVGVVKTTEKGKWWKNDINNTKKIKYLKLNQLKNLNYDLGLSINYNKKIKKNILKTAKIGFLNIHYSYKNYYRGRNIMFMSIINYPTQMAGFTIHWMDQNFDSGKILYTKKVIINKKDTSETLYIKIEKELVSFLKNNFIKNFDKFMILKPKLPLREYLYFKKKKFQSFVKKYLKKNNSKDNKIRIIRALTFKNYNKKLISKLNRI